MCARARLLQGKRKVQSGQPAIEPCVCAVSVCVKEAKFLFWQQPCMDVFDDELGRSAFHVALFIFKALCMSFLDLIKAVLFAE